MAAANESKLQAITNHDAARDSEDEPTIDERPSLKRLRSGVQPCVSVPPTSEAPATVRAPELPLALGMRVRLVVFGDRVAVLPDDGTSAQGTAAVLLPVHAGDDLRKLFEPPRS